MIQLRIGASEVRFPESRWEAWVAEGRPANSLPIFTPSTRTYAGPSAATRSEYSSRVGGRPLTRMAPSPTSSER